MKKKKAMNRRQTVSGKDPEKECGMLEKLKARVTKVKKKKREREQHKKRLEKWTRSRSLDLLYPQNNRKSC